MELANLNSEWADEQRRVFMKSADNPKYPKPLTVPELLAQVDRVPYAVLTEKAGQFGGGGKLSSQFKNYIRQCSCACWSSWEKAWEDFAHYMGYNTLDRAVEDSLIDAAQKLPFEQILRVFKEIQEDVNRQAVVLNREGISDRVWKYCIARLADAGRVAFDGVTLKLKEEAVA